MAKNWEDFMNNSIDRPVPLTKQQKGRISREWAILTKKAETRARLQRQEAAKRRKSKDKEE